MKNNKKLLIAGNWKMNGLKSSSLMITNLMKYIKSRKNKIWKNRNEKQKK